MIIDSIQNGIVIDHISAGKAMELYRILGLDKLDCTVAILKMSPVASWAARTSSRSTVRWSWTGISSATWTPASPSTVSETASWWKSAP